MEEKDYLNDRISHDLANEPGFAETWAPFAIMGDLVRERVRLGLTQADVARQMGVSQPIVARMENNPPGVAFARILAYAKAVNASLAVHHDDSAVPAARQRRLKLPSVAKTPRTTA